MSERSRENAATSLLLEMQRSDMTRNWRISSIERLLEGAKRSETRNARSKDSATFSNLSRRTRTTMRRKKRRSGRKICVTIRSSWRRGRGSAIRNETMTLLMRNLNKKN
jgi:hypothetical protein